MTGRRILWVSTSTQTRGGVATYVRTLQQTPLWQRWEVRHLASHRNGSALLRVRVFLLALVAFVRELAFRRPAVVHLHTSSYGSFARKSVLAWISSLAGVPVVMHVHGAAFADFHSQAPPILQRYISSTLQRSDVVVALGQNWARALCAIAPRARVVIVPNAVQPQAPVVQPAAGEPVQVLFLGEVEDRKGVFLLLEAWSRLGLAPAGVAHRLVVAGGGDVERARRLARELDVLDQVTFTGWVGPEEVKLLLEHSHVLVLPSSAEGQPMAVLEAMSYGLCVVATDVGGVAELLGDGGVLLPPQQLAPLLRGLSSAIHDTERRALLAARAHDRLCEKFDVNKTWKLLDDLYEELAP